MRISIIQTRSRYILNLIDLCSNLQSSIVSMASLLARVHERTCRDAVQAATGASLGKQAASCAQGKTKACGASRVNYTKSMMMMKRKRFHGDAAVRNSKAMNLSSGRVKPCRPFQRENVTRKPSRGSMRHRKRFASEISKPQKKRRVSVAACSAPGVKCARLEDNALMVGPAQESDAMHALRHPLNKLTEWAKVCPRCYSLEAHSQGT